MFKFGIGDKVMLSANSGWADSSSNKLDSSNSLGMQGIIAHQDFYSERYRWHVEWCNGTLNVYGDEDLILVTEQPQQTCPYAIIEELEAYNESLEETVVSLTREVLELRKANKLLQELMVNHTSTSNISAVLQQVRAFSALAQTLSGYKYYEEVSDVSYLEELLLNIETLQYNDYQLRLITKGI